MKTTITHRLKSIFYASFILSALGHLALAQAPDMEDYLPVEHAITDITGRKIAVTILSKTDTTLKFRRTSDGREFDIPIDKLSPADQKFFMLLGKPGPIEESELEVSVRDTPVKVTRLGNGPIGVIFFGSSGGVREDIVSGKVAFTGLLPAKTSFFLWDYPKTGAFSEVGSAIDGYLHGDKAKLRPNFKGVASEVLTQIREKTGLKKFLLVGNSLGAGIVLWDYAEIAKDPQVNFLLISPTETFMPPVKDLPKLSRTMLLAGVEKDQDGKWSDDFMQGDAACSWVKSNLDKAAMEKITESLYGKPGSPKPGFENFVIPKTFGTSHIIIGQEIKNPLLARLIRVNLGLEKPSSLSKSLVDGK